MIRYRISPAPARARPTRGTLAVALLVCAALTGCATAPPSVVDPDVLIGAWQVDLRPTPGAPDYFKTFVVSSVSGGKFEGTFYDTPISEGRINTSWGAVRIAFETADRSGPYHHSAVLHGNRLEGLTSSSGRDFLSYWSASKE